MVSPHAQFPLPKTSFRDGLSNTIAHQVCTTKKLNAVLHLRLPPPLHQTGRVYGHRIFQTVHTLVWVLPFDCLSQLERSSQEIVNTMRSKPTSTAPIDELDVMSTIMDSQEPMVIEETTPKGRS